MPAGWIYIMANRPHGTLYSGVTNNLARRAYEHREGLCDGFTRRYGLTGLMYTEPFDDMLRAIQREKTLKHWPRAWKARLITAQNPDWLDLYDTLA